MSAFRWLVAFALATGLGAFTPLAQSATYAYRSDTFAFDTPTGSASSVAWHASGANPGCTSYPNGDDDWADIAFPAGFSFIFNGVSYTSARVYSNGILAFPPDVSGHHRDFSPSALPITTAPGAGPAGCSNAVPVNLMIPYWTDIQAGTANGTTGASVKYEQLTDALTGVKRFVITWSNVVLYTNANARYTFQIQLYSSLPGVNGNFRYQYTTGASTGTGATVGVQISTTDYTQYAFNQAFIDTTVGTAILWYPANQLAGKRAEYRFDESAWLGVAGEIKDTSGASSDATKLGLVTNTASGKLCRGGVFTANTSNATIDAIATPTVPGSKGSVDMWYLSNVKWGTAASDAVLFDATTVANRPFFLLRRSTGNLRFVATDSAGAVFTAETTTAYTFNAATWQHIAVSWSFNAGTNQTVMQIIVNGVLAATSGSTPFRATSSGAIATLGTMHIGDNRTSGVTPNTGSPNGANGTLDEVYIYPIDINATQAAADMALVRASCTTLDHFHIVHNGQSVSCGGAVASVRVEAHDANHALFTLAGTTMQMSTSTNRGTWSAVTAINPVVSGANGTGSYTFSGESSVVLGLSNSTSESLNINVASGSITERSGVASVCSVADYTFGTTCDTNLEFVEAGYLFSVPTHVSDTSQSITLQAVKKSDNSPVCVSNYANTSRNLTFSCQYTNPTTGTLPVRVGGIALNAANNASDRCDANGRAVSLSFNALGVATTTVQYADVGTVLLTGQDTVAGATTSGTSSFTAVPASFGFSAYPTTTVKADNNFSATVTAKNASGNTTPNFGRETTAETVVVSASKAQPTGLNAANGALTVAALPAFAAGATTASLAWSEVGTIDLTATLASGNYLSSGRTATGTTGTGGAVGRFIPDHFDAVLTQGCAIGGYTYSGQPFAVQVTALNKNNAITRNYDGSLGTTPNFAKVVTLSDASGIAVTPSSASGTVASFIGGTATLNPAFTFNTKLSAPASSRVRATDTDSVSSAGGTEGTVQLRSGRVRMVNGYGSPRLALPMLLDLQYWNGSTFVTNTADVCSSFVAGNFNLVNYIGGVTATNLPIARITSVTSLAPANPGKWSVTLSPPAPQITVSGAADLFLNLGATGANVTCPTATPANVLGVSTSAGLPYLATNSCGVSGYDRNPFARATFGIYKSPLVYMRENY